MKVGGTAIDNAAVRVVWVMLLVLLLGAASTIADVVKVGTIFDHKQDIIFDGSKTTGEKVEIYGAAIFTISKRVMWVKRAHFPAF